MVNKDLNRDVRTLLFSKISPAPHENNKDQVAKDHDELYQQIYKLSSEGSDSVSSDLSYTFLTFGGYDAIRVYQPKLDAHDSKWLHKIYEDKQRIIQMPSNDIIYHQIHLVSEHPDTQEFWSVQRDEEYPFFLATLIYGVNTEKLEDAKRKYADKHSIKDINQIFFGSSKYEQLIRLHMEEHRQKWEDQVRFAIYNGITSADIVVLWRAKNLNSALNALTHIEYSGVARKTLTTIGFPIGSDGRIKRCVMENLIQNMDQSITISIQGSIRDFKECLTLQQLFTEMLPESTCANIRAKSLSLMEVLKHTSGIFIEELQRLSCDLSEAASQERFTEELLKKVYALSTEADRHLESLPYEIMTSVSEIVKEAEEQARNPVDKIKKTVQDLSERSFYDPEARARIHGALHSGKMKHYLDNIHIIAKKSNNYEQYMKCLQDLLPSIYRELCCGMYNPQWMQSLGKSDFTVTARISYANLANLLEIYRKHHKELSNACWEFLTDVKIDHSFSHYKNHDSWIEESKRPTNVLCKLCTDFQDLCQNKDQYDEKLDLHQYSWFNALQELLCAHHYIDHHPVLHGPSYLVYNSLKIAYSYFAGLVPDYQSVTKQALLLNRSEENIIDFIRNLDQLTEQLSRNDDAILNNRTTPHTIHFSLPESALEFYHAFLRRIVNFLVQFDRDEERIPANFEYDFLLSPKTCGNFRFRPMLRTEHSDHPYQAGMVWPQKQAYILELPLESIFNPIDIFVPFVHESFHCFGDTLRQRQCRKQYMSLFIASNLLDVVDMNRPEYSRFCGEIARMIYSTGQTKTDFYLTTSWQQLVSKTEKLLAEDTLVGLTKLFDGRIKEDTLLRWLATKKLILKIEKNSSLFAERMTYADAILKNCKIYFKECYADAMTVALLQISPREYLRSSRDVLRRFHYKYRQSEIPGEAQTSINSQRTHLAQRFAIVLATCCFVHSKDPENRPRDFTKYECIAAIDEIGCLDDSHIDRNVNYSEFSRILKECFVSLIDSSRPMTLVPTLHPPSTLRYVIDYLINSVQLLYNKQTVLTIPGCSDSKEPGQRYTCNELADQFDMVIRQGNMFGEEFYQMIHSHHEEIRKVVVAISTDTNKS